MIDLELSEREAHDLKMALSNHLVSSTTDDETSAGALPCSQNTAAAEPNRSIPLSIFLKSIFQPPLNPITTLLASNTD